HRSICWCVAKNDEFRGLLGTMTDTQERSHSLLFHPSFIEHIDVETKLRSNFPRPISHVSRGQVSSRLIGHVPSKVHGLADDASALGATVDRSGLRACQRNNDLIEQSIFLINRSIFIGLKEPHDRAFDDS